MTEKEMIAKIGQRAEELSKMPSVREKAERIFREQGLDAAKQYVYMAAIATLCRIK